MGFVDGSMVGWSEGSELGIVEGVSVVGCKDGQRLGSSVGISVGIVLSEGVLVGTIEGIPYCCHTHSSQTIKLVMAHGASLVRMEHKSGSESTDALQAPLYHWQVLGAKKPALAHRDWVR